MSAWHLPNSRHKQHHLKFFSIQRGIQNSRETGTELNNPVVIFFYCIEVSTYTSNLITPLPPKKIQGVYKKGGKDNFQLL